MSCVNLKNMASAPGSSTPNFVVGFVGLPQTGKTSVIQKLLDNRYKTDSPAGKANVGPVPR